MCGTEKQKTLIASRRVIQWSNQWLEKNLVLDKLDLLPMKRASVLLLFDAREVKVNHVFILKTQLKRMVGRGQIRVC